MDEHPGGLVEMAVESVRVHMLSSQHVVILKETGRERYLPIWIGPWEANAIAMRLQGVSAERPLTHDTFATVLEEMGVRLVRVVVVDLAEETFHARLFMSGGGREVEIDARPSDALALAVRMGARIFAAREVLERAGVEPGEEGEDGEEGDDRVPDEGLAIFRDFVNSLPTDQEGETREGPPES